jgi:hypothetical protein
MDKIYQAEYISTSLLLRQTTGKQEILQAQKR